MFVHECEVIVQSAVCNDFLANASMQRERLFPRKSGFLKHSKMSEPIGLYRKDQSYDMQKETKDVTSRRSLVSQCCQLWRRTNKKENVIRDIF